VKTAAEIAAAVRDGRASAAEVTTDALARAEHHRGLSAFTQVFTEQARTQAAAVDDLIRERGGAGLPLAGVPVAVKDNICIGPDTGYGGRTTCASRMLEHYESPFTATCVRRLIDAGAVVIGKTNLDEFAMGSSTEHSCFGPTLNPWDQTRVPGGSSGGSAAAVAARICPVALGSDTGGSIRQPAGFCGVVGAKPTYGRVSRYGLVAFASSLDQVGPFATNVADAALALEAISGLDPFDATSADRAVPAWSSELDTPITGLTLGVPAQARAAANHPGVTAALDAMIAVYRELGATVIDIDLPLIDEGIAAYYILAPAEASSNLARFDGVRFGRRAALGDRDSLLDLYTRSRAEGFGPEVKRRVMLGTHVLSSGYYDAYYATALKVRRRILDGFNAAFARCHAILMPTSPGPAFRLGEKAADPLALYMEDVYTVGVNLAGLPAFSVPAGFADGLPVGVQVIAPAFEEARLFTVARMFERETTHHQRVPPR